MVDEVIGGAEITDGAIEKGCILKNKGHVRCGDRKSVCAAASGLKTVGITGAKVIGLIYRLLRLCIERSYWWGDGSRIADWRDVIYTDRKVELENICPGSAAREDSGKILSSFTR
jgi:hypothetical protein